MYAYTFMHVIIYVKGHEFERQNDIGELGGRKGEGEMMLLYYILKK